MEETYKLADKISQMNHPEIHDKINEFDMKYTYLSRISSLYQTNQLINLKVNIIDNIPLKANVSLEDVSQASEGISEQVDKEFTDALKRQYQTIEKLLKDIQMAHEKNDQLRGRVNLLGIEDEIIKYQEVEELLLTNKHHPQAHIVLEAYQDKVDQFADQLLEIEDKISVDSDTVKSIYSSQYLAQALTAADMDPRPLVALTFDDGPTQYTRKILEILEKNDIQATFFLLGQSVEIYPDITREIYDRGHLIGNHSYSHPNFDQITDREILQEIDITQKIIANITGEPVMAFRTPYGNGKGRTSKLYPDLMPIHWNVDSTDWVNDDAQITVETVMDNLQDRSIILMHDSKKSTVEAIELLIPQLKKEGYHFVTPDKIPEADNYY